MVSREGKSIEIHIIDVTLTDSTASSVNYEYNHIKYKWPQHGAGEEIINNSFKMCERKIKHLSNKLANRAHQTYKNAKHYVL